VTFEVIRDGQSGSGLGQRFDGEVGGGPDASLDAVNTQVLSVVDAGEPFNTPD
jgi:hypothetical protein